MTTLGRLLLVPAPLDFGCATTTPLQDVLPQGTLVAAAQLGHWVCENAKSARAYLKRIDALVKSMTTSITDHRINPQAGIGKQDMAQFVKQQCRNQFIVPTMGRQINQVTAVCSFNAGPSSCKTNPESTGFIPNRFVLLSQLCDCYVFETNVLIILQSA